jgi:hypothetical protein
MTTFTERMKGAALLNSAIYEEVEADTTATGQAALVVVIASVSAAIGASGIGLAGAFGSLLLAIIGWLVWAGVTYLIGVHVFGGTATWGELLRTLGFAHAPGVLSLLGIIPLLGSAITLAIMLWVLVCGVIAIRQALDFSTEKAVLTALLGWLLLAIPSLLLSRMLMTVQV